MEKPSYKVGYGSPPRENQFKPGKSGNPSGRPRKSKNPDTIAKEEINRMIVVNDNGHRYKMSALQACLRQIVNMAIKGNAQSQRMVISLVKEIDLLTYVSLSEGAKPIVDHNFRDLSREELVSKYHQMIKQKLE